MPHPLIGALKTPVDDTPAEVPVSGWIRIRFGVAPRISVRALGFNMTTASNLTTIRGERLGRGNGRTGQVFSLGNANVAAGTLALTTRDEGRNDAITAWREVEDFDSAGPDEAVFVLDAEAGVVLFGDGVRGRPPQADEIVIAAVYRHGGGLAGDVDTGAVSQPAGLPATLAGAVNVTPARGGRDAEKLDAAKARAPHAFRARGRAVTQADFADAALAAPGVRVARAMVVPLHRPFPQGHVEAGLDAPGIDFTAETPGALTVIVVPEQAGPYPMPTTGELTAVAAHLDTLRLLTTEVHVTTPQYVRLFDFEIVVRAAPGYTTTALREAIGAALERRFHVLTGGRDGTGSGFGELLHHADLVAEIFRVPGVERVEAVSCLFDGQTPDHAERFLAWRRERQVALRLTNCPKNAADFDSIDLAGDEVPFVDASSLTVTVVDAP
jgi:predicted phage baseplate assembly protein